MILVFGGTTEGRKTVAELEEAGNPFFYSTKQGEQNIALLHGIPLCGAMPENDMIAFCRSHSIRLIIDAAHPFASHLHHTIARVSRQLHLPVIRYERIYPPRNPAILWVADYEEAIRMLTDKATPVRRVLSTCGVQSISRLRPLKQMGVRLWFRILPRQSSRVLAYEQGACDEELCYYPSPSDTERSTTEDDVALFERLHPDVVLVKESGESGGFEEKTRAALSLGIRVMAIKRPVMPEGFLTVNGEHGLRRMVEHVLPEFYPLHSGLTTGTCATAAALAACFRLLKDECPTSVPVILPNGETIPVDVLYHNDGASVIKDSGDDPDVTNGLEIQASVSHACDAQHENIIIKGGKGVGTITLPGFDSPVGESAINRVPREMIRDNILAHFPDVHLVVTISIPQGEEIARRTFNPRLGIVGGISVVGVSGIIKPFSKAGFLDSIKKCMQVAKASGCDRVVINSGAKSERFVKVYYPALPSQVFVEYGNYIGDTIRMASELHFPQVTLGVMLGKAVKLAAGCLDTHSKKSVMDKSFILDMLREAQCDDTVIRKAEHITLARELWKIIPESQLQRFAEVVIKHCYHYCAPLLPKGQLTILLIDEEGNIYHS